MGTLKKGQTIIYKTFLRKSNKRSSNTNLNTKFENTKSVIRSRKLKKDKQYNGNIKKDKGTNNGLQITTHKTKGRETPTPPTVVVNSGIPDG
jgi:hypothetical protein